LWAEFIILKTAVEEIAMEGKIAYQAVLLRAENT
jgi:hypothetical protein